jgi:hypothetical protein
MFQTNLVSLIQGRNFGGHIIQYAVVNPPYNMASQFPEFGIEFWWQEKFSVDIDDYDVKICTQRIKIESHSKKS